MTQKLVNQASRRSGTRIAAGYKMKEQQYNKESTILREATTNDLDNIAALHAAAFPGFFLTSLGPMFLKHMYMGYIEEPSGIILIAEHGIKPTGFIAGTTDPEQFFKNLKTRKGPLLFCKTLPALIKNPMPVMKKIFKSFFYLGEKPPNLVNSTLLSSIAVSPEHQKNGTGRKMLEEFERAARSKDAKHIHLTTDQLNNCRTLSFYEKSGYTLESSFINSGKRVMNRYIKNI